MHGRRSLIYLGLSARFAGLCVLYRHQWSNQKTLVASMPYCLGSFIGLILPTQFAGICHLNILTILLLCQILYHRKTVLCLPIV